jgi:ketosteroid isomerase-like protein
MSADGTSQQRRSGIPDLSDGPRFKRSPAKRKEIDNDNAHRDCQQLLHKLKTGDAPAALGLMAPDIEWITMWHYKVDGRGPGRVAEDLFKPLVAEWSTFALVPTEFMADGDTVVSLGDFTGVHGTTGKKAEARYAHVWTIKDGKIARFRQYIDTQAVAEARRS